MAFLAIGGMALQAWLCRVALGFSTLGSNTGTRAGRLSENTCGRSSLQNGARQLHLEKFLPDTKVSV